MTYEYPEDFEIFFRKFKIFVNNVKCETFLQFDLLLGFLVNLVLPYKSH